MADIKIDSLGVPLLPDLEVQKGNESSFGELTGLGQKINEEIDRALELPVSEDSKPGFDRRLSSGFSSRPNSDFSSRPETDLTRKFNLSSGIFTSPQKIKDNEPPANRSSLPLGFRRAPDFQDDNEGAQSYLRSRAMQTIRDKAEKSDVISTDQYIESEINGGINTLIHIVRFFHNPKTPFTKYDIGDLIMLFKDSKISASTLGNMRLEITSLEALNKFLLSDSQITQLKRLNIISDDSIKTNGTPLEYRSTDGRRFILRHFNNLISLNEPQLGANGLDSWNTYHFRVANKEAHLVRVDENKKIQNSRTLKAFLILLKADEKRFAHFLNK
ncbi:MAG: hypothetical protein RBS56_04125 [Candidatus Gracilibacteria bacterium]|jgi:hypothetical protein|nr:hypothetical protein [Candidatus Gracilibacteria bacterium]